MRPASVLWRVNRRRPRDAPLTSFKHKPQEYVQKRLPRNVEDAAHEALKQKPYYDPANNTLDFTKSNKALLQEIVSQSKKRTQLRIKDPATSWAKTLGNKKKVEEIKESAKWAITASRISSISSLRPLSVGDVVILSKNSTLLHLVVAAPSTLASNVYTFVNHEGEVTFGTKHHICLRIPGVFTSEQTEKMNLVAVEKKWPNLAPIGIPDSAFSRAKEPSSSGTSENASTISKISSPSLSPLEPASASLDAGPRDFTVAQASSQVLTNTTVNTYVVPTSAREVYARHFTEISIDAFRKIPRIGDKLDYFHRVLQYDDSGALIQAARTIPIFDLFNIVMSNKRPSRSGSSDPSTGSSARLSADSTPESSIDLENELKSASASLRKFSHGDSQALGMTLPDSTARTYATATYPASSYIAFVIALSRSGRKWKLNIQKSTRAPISVDVLPFSGAQTIDDTLDYLKSGGLEQVSAQIVENIKNKPKMTKTSPHYRAVIQLLKDFVAGNVENDHTMESLSGGIVREVDTKLQGEGKSEIFQMPFSHEFARSRAYEILMLLEKTGDRNPLCWNSALGLPNTGTSNANDRFQSFYNFLDTQFSRHPELLSQVQGNTKTEESNVPAENDKIDINASESDVQSAAMCKYLADDFYLEDPMSKVREDFGETPVYCIDSETAHEIDDGISVEDLGNDLAITVHIANPTSYLKPTSSLSQIALKKGTTIYLPEGPTMMLPDTISKLCGLNGEHMTRTLGIRFLVPRTCVQEYKDSLLKDSSNKPSNRMAKTIQQAIENSVAVKFYNVRRFPKGFTYNKVNQVLNNTEHVKNFFRNALKPESDEYNLFTLHLVADLVKHMRISVGSGVEMNSDRSRVSVTYSTETTKKSAFTEIENGWQVSLEKGEKIDTPVISISREVNQNKDSKSQHLVSNLMIAANYAGSVFAEREGFPIIYRHSELVVKESVAKEIRDLSQRTYMERKDLNPDERSQLLAVLTSANFSTFQLKHDLLGVKLYSNLTSPLRRYVDMINHWKFQDYVLMLENKRLGLECENLDETQLSRDKSRAKPQTAGKNKPKTESTFSTKQEFGMRTSDMDFIASHLQGCELKNRMAQKFSDTFWTTKFLRRYFELKHAGKIEKPINLSLLLSSDAKFGDVRAELIGFDSLRTTILQTPFVTQQFANGEWKVGQVLDNPRFRILKLDFIEGEFTIELVSPEDTSADVI